MMKTRFFLFMAAITTTIFQANGQTVNGYAEVTDIAGNVLTLGTVDESAHTFEDGEWVVLMQMQDDVIGDVTNSATFGDIGDVYNAGVYEIRQISNHAETAGVPTSITLMNTPNFGYNICANCHVQIITFRQFGTPDYTTTANMSAKDWDGTTGGVLAFYVDGTLTLQHSFSADYAGFRGAGPNAGGSAGCSGGGNYRVTTQQDFADKGESIYRNTTGTYNAGMGKILNGGGGGNSHNGGGGGGGNYTSGGDGGPGWPTCNPSAGGLGGLSLQTYTSVNRIFMGGGGGAGEGNNNLSTDGGDGGGIILIRATEIETDVCSGVSITASGENIAFAGNDGGGGGGAGGSIVLEVNTWNIAGGCPLTVEANGGDGGAVNNGDTHGGGGGGGQGVVFYSSSEPTTNVITNTNNGVGGCDNNSNPCNSQAGNGNGTDGDGVQDLLTGPLPIELVGFNATLSGDQVLLEWETKSEINNDYFIVEHSLNATEWKQIATIDGAGNSSTNQYYSTHHTNPSLGINYYRLRQVDFNGTYSFSETENIKFEENQTLLYPNPAGDLVNIYKSDIGSYQVQLYSITGQEIQVEFDAYENLFQLQLEGLAEGIYIVRISSDNYYEQLRFTIGH